MAFAYTPTYGTAPALKKVLAGDVSGIVKHTFTITAATASMAGVTDASQAVLRMVVDVMNVQPIGLALAASVATVKIEHTGALAAASLATALNAAWVANGGSGTEFTVAAV